MDQIAHQDSPGIATVLTRIDEAIGSGEVLRIRYEGGSQPGAIRDLVPLQRIGDDRLRAKCTMSHAVKTFMIGKIRLVDEITTPPAPSETWTAGRVTERYAEIATVEALHARVASLAEGGRLVLQLTSDAHGPLIAMHERKRNGEPKKHPVATFGYATTRTEHELQADGTFAERVLERDRPWFLRAKGGFRGWRDKGKAIDAFLEFVGVDVPH